MELSDSLTERERDLVAKNDEIDAKTNEILQRVQAGRAAASSIASSTPRPTSARTQALQPAATLATPTPTPATTTLSSAEITALRAQLKASVEKAQRLEGERDRQQQEVQKGVKVVAALKAKVARDEAKHEEAAAKAKEALDTVQGQRRDATALKKSLRAVESQLASKEAQLQRALEEVCVIFYRICGFANTGK